MNHYVKLPIFALAWLLIQIGSTSAHNVWLHPPRNNAQNTVDAFYKSGEVYNAVRSVMDTWYKASGNIELGVMAEFESKIDSKKSTRPDFFRETLLGLNTLKSDLTQLGKALAELHAVVSQGDINKEFDSRLTSILAEDSSIVRLSIVGRRYSDIAGAEPVSDKIVGIVGVVSALQSDLKILQLVLDDTIEALRDAIPLAENGEFAKVMLSGRNAFGDKMPQFTDMIAAYDRFYVQMCMATIASTMQVYPKGFEWLN